MRKTVTCIVSILVLLSLSITGRISGNADAAEENTAVLYGIQAVSRTDSELRITLTSESADTVPVFFAAAAYSGSGRILSANAVSQSMEYPVSLTLPLPEETERVKAFVLNPSTLSPLRPAWEWDGVEPEGAEKALVAYFSATGTTKGIAEQIAEITGADLYEITPAVPYTSADLNYSDRSTRATVEQNDTNARPAITGTVANMERYKVVFLGYPIQCQQLKDFSLSASSLNRSKQCK